MDWKLEQVVEQVRAACIRFRESGGEIIHGLWGVRHHDGKWVVKAMLDGHKPCTCAFGAVIMVDPTLPYLGSAEDSVAGKFEVHRDLIDCFISGWDGDMGVDLNSDREREWHAAGATLRAELRPISYAMTEDAPPERVFRTMQGTTIELRSEEAEASKDSWSKEPSGSITPCRAGHKEAEMMTRKDYQRAAAIVKENWNAHGIVHEMKSEKLTAVQTCEVMKLVAQSIEDSFAEFFRGDNPRFDEARFREACKK